MWPSVVSASKSGAISPSWSAMLLSAVLGVEGPAPRQILPDFVRKLGCLAALVQSGASNSTGHHHSLAEPENGILILPLGALMTVRGRSFDANEWLAIRSCRSSF